MLKTLAWFLAFSLLFPPSGLAGDNSSWRKPYRTNFKSPEHYTSLERLQQREKDLERWIQRNKPITYSPPKELAPKIKPPEKVKIPEPPKPKFNKLESPKPSLPKNKITVEKKMIDGRMHYIKTIERFDKFGNFTRRDVIDRVKLDKKTTLTTIKSYTPDGTLIRQVEKLKIKGKGGYQIQKYVSTQFDSSDNPLNRLLVKNNFKRTGFFNSTFGKVLGFAAVAAGAIIAPYAFASLAGVAASILSLGTVALTSSIGSAFAQFGVSLAQGHSVGKALLSAGITAAATFATAGLAQFLGPKGIGPILDKLGPLGKPLQIFGNNLGRGLDFVKSAGLEKTLQFGAFASKVLQGTALRVGSAQFETALSKRLGAFGAAAVLSFTTGLAGLAVSPASANPFTPEAIASAGIRALAQGGIAEAFRNHRSVGAQFLREFASLSTSGLDIRVVGSVALPIRSLGGQLVGIFYRDGDKNVYHSTELRQGFLITDRAADYLSKGKLTPLMEREIGKEVIGLNTDADLFTVQARLKDLRDVQSSPFVQGVQQSSFWRKTGTGMLEFGKGLVAGDFIQNPTPLNVAGQIIGGLNPVADARDVIANTKTIIQTGGTDGKLGLTFALIGSVPFFGDLAKTLRNSSNVAGAVTSAEKVAVKEIKVTTTSSRKIVIGENMDRVNDYASKIGGETIDDWLKHTGQNWTPELNNKWMNQMKSERAYFYDIGPDFDRRLQNRINPYKGKPPSGIYGAERKDLLDYDYYQKLYKRSGKYEGGVPGYDDF